MHLCTAVHQAGPSEIRKGPHFGDDPAAAMCTPTVAHAQEKIPRLRGTSQSLQCTQRNIN